MQFQFVTGFSGQYLPVSASEMDRLEETYHFTFPAVLREYYLRYNGCETASCLGKMEGDLFIVTEILPIGGGDISLEDMIRFDRDNEIIQPHLIPFAQNGLAGVYYFDAHTENIFLSYREDEEDFTFICAGMETFFHILNQTCHGQDEDNAPDINEIIKERNTWNR